MTNGTRQRRRTNEPNFRVTAGTAVLRDTWQRLPACAGMALLRRGLLRQTNPISGRAKWRASVVQVRTCAERGALAAPEEQSQLGQGAGLTRHGSAACPSAPEPRGGCTNEPDFRVTGGTAVLLMGGTPMLRNAWRRHYERGFCAKRSQFDSAQMYAKCYMAKGLRMIQCRTGLEKRSQSAVAGSL